MKRVALVGMPNTGKSTLFNRLTGAHARVGNWPGITVDLLSARILLGDGMVELVDLPGVYDLAGYSDDEAVVMRFLGRNPVDLVIVVLNAGQIERQLHLVAQLTAGGAPLLLVLNMADEAKTLGITIDVEKMARGLGIPVCLLSAKYGQGTERLRAEMVAALRAGAATERALSALDDRAVEAVLHDAVSIPAQASHTLTERLDRIFLHPWLGLPVFFAVMFLLFNLVFAVGEPLQDALEAVFDALRAAALEPLVAPLPQTVRSLLLDGVYSGLATVATFVPLIVLFFVCMAIVEDTGYLSRAAFLMDALMSRFGLDGRSFVMVLMGFGCNVPALMGTRVMRSRGLRLLTMLTIPMSLCSARLQVFVFFIAALFSGRSAPLALFSLYLLSMAAVMVTALAFKGRYVNRDSFVLEIPPYRFPTVRQIALRGWHEVRHFLKRATRFIVAGVVLVWALTHFPAGAAAGSPDSWAGQIGTWLNPVLSPVGIDPQLTIALIFGFVAKEIVIGSLAVIYAREGSALVSTLAHQITWVQAYSFMIFTLLYTPCLSTIATIRQEARSFSFTALALLWPLALAWLASFAFYRVASALYAG